MNIAGTALLLVLLRRRLRRIEFARTAAATLRIVVAAGVLAAVSYGVWRALDGVVGRALWAQCVSVGFAIAAGTVVYAAAVWILRVPEARQIRALVAGRIRGSG